ncbi:MAG TPA: protein DpdJ [Polyangiaceae bacterium]|nr:protein DpdJ [Polyangiaceae bacterium]
MAVNEHALEFLGVIERAEESLLTWGLVDGFFSEDELVQRADDFLAALGTRGVPGGYDSGWELLEALLDDNLLWKVPNTERYRTRMAETVRLFCRLRQIFPDARNAAWRTAAGLVADYRLLIRHRMYPRREVVARDVVAAVRREVPLSSLQEAIIRALVRAGTPEERPLARFQVRAIGRVLGGVTADRSLGTVVCAGTGSGKTLAFYLPAYAAMAARLSGEYWTKCLALYPRNELLKDQFREALANARRIGPALEASGKRKLVIGALYGDVPRTARAILEPGRGPVWRRVTVRTAAAYECPFVRCPRCNDSMVWPEADAQRDFERLVCSGSKCDERIEADEIRLTRERMLAEPPDVLFTSTEMLNQRLSSRRFARLFGIGIRSERRPDFVLLDEAHAYEGVHGAHVALLLRRWRRASEARPHFVGLSATLADAPQFFAELVGVGPGDVSEVSPEESEMRAEGAEYMLALRGDPSSGASLLSTTIQALMLLRRVLAPARSQPPFGSRVFAFTDNLDIINRLYHNLLDAEGWDSFGRPNPRRAGGSLANLRATTLPNARERLDAGQNWSLVEEIGHVLAPASRVRVSRTSSQDAGVDTNAEVIVATSALEVGFDDPEVGAILQHKAPQSAAAFLQRKGRAGRRQDMRPWTIVVLSDYGRDRNAYQAYDQLFSPHLPPRHLPIGNRAVLRMQATYALLDWLARRLPPSQTPDPWTDFSQPAEAIQSANFSQSVRARQELYAEYLRALLEQGAARGELSLFLARSLAINEDEVSALLWEPPRAILTEAVPTLLRRLERGWRRATAGGQVLESHIPRAPLPEFVPRTLFSDLQLPEVSVRLPGLGRIAARVEPMPLAQALREFAPGRVSRRFGVSHGGERYWIAPDGTPDVLIDSFCPAADRQELGRFAYRDTTGAVATVPVFRPHALDVAVTPLNVQQSSNAFLAWHAEIVQTGQGHEVDAPERSPWTAILRPFRFHTHHFGLPLEVRRFATGAVASVGLGTQRQVERALTFVCASAEGTTEPAALGFVADVDGVQVRFAFPHRLCELCARDEPLLRSLRPARFKDLVRTTPLLDGVANGFQREWLALAYLSTVTAEALRTGSSLEQAEAAVHARNSRTTIAEVLETILQAAAEADVDSTDSGDGSTGDDGAVPRRLQELLELLNLDRTNAALHDAARVLWGLPNSDWEMWLRARFSSTLASAIVDAAQNLCPRMDPGALVIDLDAGVPEAPADVAIGDAGEIWLTEETIGGGGFLEEFMARYAEDPRRFFRLLDAALAPSDLELVGLELERLLDIVTAGAAEHAAVGAAFTAVRTADSHEGSTRALRALRSELARRGICPTPTLLVSVNTRLLRPGTNAQTDAFLATAVRSWNETEQRLGIDIDARVLAFVQSADPALEQALGVTPAGDSDRTRAIWRYSVLYGMLWPRGAQVRAEALRHSSSFSRLPDCDRLLVLTAVLRPVREVVLASATWFEELCRVLVQDGTVELVAPVSEAASLVAALLRVASDPVDSEALLVHARLTGVHRDGQRIRAGIELPEAVQ